MNEYGWRQEEAERLTHYLLPELTQLATLKGVISASITDHRLGETNVQMQEQCVSWLIKLLADMQGSQETGMRELLKEYYALIYNGGSQTPLDLFYSGAPYETKNFQSNCKVTLPPGVNGQLSNLWRTVPEFSQCESLQCVYWFSCIWAVPSIPIETRLLLSVLGVRILVRDDWFLSGGCFEEEFFSKAKELHTIHIGYQNDRVYMQVGRFMLGALIADGIRQAGELSAAQGLPAERNEGTPSHLSSDEQRMLELLKENPRMTHKELGSRLGKSERGSQRCAQRLQSLGVLVRNGSTRAGGWVVVHRDSSGKGSM